MSQSEEEYIPGPNEEHERTEIARAGFTEEQLEDIIVLAEAFATQVSLMKSSIGIAAIHLAAARVTDFANKARAMCEAENARN